MGRWSVVVSMVMTLSVWPARAQQTLVAAQSEITFTSKQMGVPVEGRFRQFDAKIAFDPNHPTAAKIGFVIDLASVSLGAAESEAELAKPDWFHTAKFPRATFQSTSVKATGTGQFEIAGKLVIKEASRDVVVPATLSQNGGTTVATGEFVIKRLDFGIGSGEWKDTSIVANEVQVKFKLRLTGVPSL